MPYYRGDYYRGDNYNRGDFLGIGKAIKKIGGVALGAVGGFLKGGPLGALAGGAKALIPSGPSIQRPIVFSGGGNQMPEGGIGGVIHRAIPGGHPGYGHFKKNGEWTDRARPHMQVTNTRALKRAGRRVRGFLKIAARLGALPVSRSGKGKLFKRKRRA